MVTQIFPNAIMEYRKSSNGRTHCLQIYICFPSRAEYPRCAARICGLWDMSAIDRWGLRLFLPSRHPFLQKSKFALLRVTHAPFVVGVTLFELLFCANNTANRATPGVLRPPSSRSAKVAAKRASFYGQMPSKLGGEMHIEEHHASTSVELGDVHSRLKKVEQDISNVKEMLREILDKL